MKSSFELRALRERINATASRMAELVGLPVTKYKELESSVDPLPDSTARLLRYMQEGVVDGRIAEVLPEFMVCSDAKGETTSEWLMHSRYPRFLAIIQEQPIAGLTCSSVDDLEYICVALWIDEPVGAVEPLMNRAATAFAAYTQESFNE